MHDSLYSWMLTNFLRQRTMPRSLWHGAVSFGLIYVPLINRLERRQFQLHLIDEAPAPILAGLERGNDGMVDGGRVLACVTIFRIVAASHVTAGAAHAQVHPRVAADQAFHTSIARWGHWLYTIEMLAMLIWPGHVSP
jgi:hypothetical protein